MLPLTTMFVFILTGNLMGLIPGLKSPTSNINVTLGCALTVAVYYHIQDPSTFGVQVQPINPIPVGMAFRPADSALAAAVKSAIDAMYSDGTMCRILKKWSLTAFVLKGQSC